MAAKKRSRATKSSKPRAARRATKKSAKTAKSRGKGAAKARQRAPDKMSKKAVSAMALALIEAAMRGEKGVKLSPQARREARRIYGRTARNFIESAAKNQNVLVMDRPKFKRFILTHARKIARKAQVLAKKNKAGPAKAARKGAMRIIAVSGDDMHEAAVAVMTRAKGACDLVLQKKKNGRHVVITQGPLCDGFLATEAGK